MIEDPQYVVSRALTGEVGPERFVIVDGDDRLHAASYWLQSLTNLGRSANTVKHYGSRAAWYLSWTAQTADWRAVTLSHIALWRQTVAVSPFAKTNGATSLRKDKTVDLWLTPVRSLYEWAEAEGMLTTDIGSRMTQIKYFPPGTPAGGEYGARRRVLDERLRSRAVAEPVDPEWIDDAEARLNLESLPLRARDRFLIDLMYFTGIRVGEALSLFTADLHFGGGSRAVGCKTVDPHFHVRLDNPVENGARAKGGARMLFVGDDLVEKYIDYALERESVLGNHDMSPHVFVNLYNGDDSRGFAMKYSGVRSLMKRCGKSIGVDLSGPHILRHTLATRLVRGIDCQAQSLDVVQEILGHSSINSTRVYTHGLEEAKKAALMSIPARTVSLGSAK
ncbi:tyrosine-type recombinase/integrase [Arthrobacter sp. B2a2-09]|uniref:tyrosine-type recombinase/integrase n=1 Tax=Arthrobacter sp. B2a2-09 TaxID=2952822 RepID=UPI0022CD818A|nr:tyrosine-type recombinase/integrase [Arthrobacter sp. B2a2-09]MCZ9880726.1 tyrosine-type recombinase/integrase [Arthrobacter sp. B2a2-09]